VGAQAAEWPLAEGVLITHASSNSGSSTPGTEWERAVDRWNDTHRDYPGHWCMHQLFEAQVERTPDAIAIITDRERLTYRELNERANRLAHLLRRLGAGPECWVGVCLDRSAHLPVAMLAVLKAGAAYAPMDPRHPRERLAFQLDDLQPVALIALERLADRLPESGIPVVLLDAATIAKESGRNPQTDVSPKNVAYVIYTSGSSGRPKGVAIKHQGAANLMQWAREDIDPEDFAGVLAASSISCDCQLFEIFCPLGAGAKVVLAENLLALPVLRAAREVTLVGAAPTAMAGLLRIGGLPTSVRSVKLSGEALQPSLVEQLYSRTSVRRVFNLYGASEASTYTTCAALKRGASGPVPIGRPIANTQVYLLDGHLRLAQVGEEAEIHVGGVGLARGYINQPELNARKFIPHPFSNEQGARLYKTGDLGRYLSDGSIEFLGRMDDQVKIRGFRVELGEIEAALQQHPVVADAAVLLREDTPGDKRLVAYVVKHVREEIDFRAFLATKLPEYMVPMMVELDSLPLAPNGKVNRSALAPPPILDSGELAMPRGPVEKTLAKMMAELLGVTNVDLHGRIDVHTSFFDLGGHSLLAAELVYRLCDTFKVDLPLRSVFEAPSIAALASRVASAPPARESIRPPLRSFPHNLESPPSFAQEWMLDFMERSGLQSSHLLRAFIATHLQGQLDIGRLAWSLNEVVRRHEALRTIFQRRGCRWVQVITGEVQFDLPVTDLSHLSTSAREAEAQAQQEAGQPFDVATGPLLRASLLRLGKHEHVLLLGVHHIVFDGWSRVVFFRELSTLYNMAAGCHVSLSALPLQYADFSIWQREWLRGPTLDVQLGYWRTRLADLPQPLRVPTDFSRSATSSFSGARRSVQLPPELTKELKALSRREGAPSAAILFAVFNVLLWRRTGQEDIVVASPVANRHPPEVGALIGLFANTLPMRTDLSGNPTFSELLRRTNEAAFEAYAHRDIHVAEIEKALGIDLQSPVMFNVQNGVNLDQSAIALAGLRAAPFEVEFDRLSRRDLTVSICEEQDRLTVAVVYNRDWFSPQTIDRMVADFQLQIEAAIRDPGQRISELASARPANGVGYN
jgi:amino acid adenylation domain-containing protein